MIVRKFSKKGDYQDLTFFRKKSPDKSGGGCQVQLNNQFQKTLGVSGGHACVRNTRIPVWTLVSLRQQLT